MKKYKLLYSKSFVKSMEKLDKYVQLQIKSYIINNLENIDNPRNIGKGLKGNLSNYWRYRIGNYRILAEIVDDKLIIYLLEIGHRKSVYK